MLALDSIEALTAAMLQLSSLTNRVSPHICSRRFGASPSSDGTTRTTTPELYGYSVEFPTLLWKRESISVKTGRVHEKTSGSETTSPSTSSSSETDATRRYLTGSNWRIGNTNATLCRHSAGRQTPSRF
jgi:hypothetical protein